MSVFIPQGAPLTFTAATSAPTSVLPLSTGGVDCHTFRLVNESSTISCVIGWGASDALAKANAAGVNANSCVIPAFAIVDVTAPPGAYFSGIASSTTAVIYVQAGLFQA